MRTNYLATLIWTMGAAALIACGSEDPTEPSGTGGAGPGAGGGLATGGTPGGGGAPAAGGGDPGSGGMMEGCDIDFSDLDTSMPVSLRNDVIPMFAMSCSLASACHPPDRPKAGLPLGPRMMDLTEDLANQIHMALLMPSTTAPAMNRVTPNDPGNSFIMHKMANNQENLGLTCTPQDSTATGCGNDMPPAAGLCAQNNGQSRFDMVARWIAQGAQNN